MAEPLSREELRRYIDAIEDHPSEQFEVLRQLAAQVGRANGDLTGARDLVIRLLEKQQHLGGVESLLEALVRHVGLYPYVDPARLPVADQIVLEAHRPIDMPEPDLVFHAAQSDVYRELMNGRNVILSAPTSFGKSLIIDAIVASQRHNNIVIVVPTLALIDETRRRLARFGGSYKLITHSSQKAADRNLFILTQERVIDFPELPNIDFFVIDEFYKLDLHQDEDRAALLNQAFYALLLHGAQFYMLGPNISAMTAELPEDFVYHFFSTEFSTVASDLIRVDTSAGDRESLVGLCHTLDDPTLVYCRSPRQTRDVARWLLDARVSPEAPDLTPAITWIGEHFHHEWLVGQALARGIGIHHGRLPRALGQFIVRAFNDGRLRFLVCTSTLIEGVNTAAKSVVVFDNRIARRRYDYFTFNNIRGRSGRMFRHFVGTVYLFHDPPQEELPYVDIPILSQPDDAPESLLLQLLDADLTDRSRERILPFVEQDLVGLDVLRANAGVAPEAQLAVAEAIRSDPDRFWFLLGWRGWPEYEQLEAATSFIYDHLSPNVRAGAFSARQLAFKINRLRDAPFARALIEAELASGYREITPDDAVEDALDFLRQWAGHHFPRGLMALDRIQRDVFTRIGRQPGDYSAFAAAVEARFLPFPLTALDEYGLPIEVAAKLLRYLEDAESLDDALDRVAQLDPNALPLTLFERELLEFTQDGLPQLAD